MSKAHGYLLAITLICFLLYQLLLLFTTVTVQTCLFSTWYPIRGDYFSPFWMFAAIAMLLTVASVIGVVVYFGSHTMTEKVIGILMTVILMSWHYNLWWMYQTFEIERGVISRATYFSEDFKNQFPPLSLARVLRGPAACTISNDLDAIDSV